MPGIDLLVFKNAANQTVPAGNEIIYQNDFFSASKNSPYSHYPVHNWETTEFVFVVEGYFFEWSDWKEKVQDFAAAFYNSGCDPALIASRFSHIDAEFIIVIYNKGLKTAFIFNDVLGRLPSYISVSDEYSILSRNPGFIHLFHSLTSNRQAFLETLALGFSLGSKTIYKEVDRMPGGAVIEISKNVFQQKRYHEFNYELMIDKKFDIYDEIEATKSSFIDAIKSRSRFGDLSVVALSGGLDSRAVAGAFKASGLPFELISYSDRQGYAIEDVTYAKRIAEALGKQLKILELPEPDSSDFELYFKIKYGLNALDMTYLINFYRHLANISDRTVLFTGDGGDKIFPDIRPPAFINTPRAIVNYAIRANAKMDLQNAADILEQDKTSVFEKIFELMSSYPEADWQLKYIHFIMDNRVSNWLTEGEDRSRSFVTSFTPFYNVRLFRQLMSVPPDEKKNFKLYGEFLKQVASETYHIPNANWGFSLANTNKLRWLYFKQAQKYTDVGQKVSRLMKGAGNYLDKLNSVENQMFFDNHEFDMNLIKRLKYFNADNFLHIITLIKSMKISKPLT